MNTNFFSGWEIVLIVALVIGYFVIVAMMKRKH